MNEAKNNTENNQGLEFWENEREYLESAMDGIKTAYAVIESCHKHALKMVNDLTPEKVI